MPHGYECDKCEEFVETSDGTPNPRDPEVVTVNHSDTPKSDHFTLCDDCRDALARWVNTPTLTGLFNAMSVNTEPIGTTSSVSIGWDAPGDEWDTLTDVSGVGPRKAKVLYDAGYESVDDLRDATQSDLSEVDAIGNALAARIMADVLND